MKGNRIILAGLVGLFLLAVLLLVRQIKVKAASPRLVKVPRSEFSDKSREKLEQIKNIQRQLDEPAPLSQEVMEVPVRPLFALSGASKKAVYDLRKEAPIKNSFRF